MKDASERGRQRVPRIGNGVAKLSLKDHREIWVLFTLRGWNQSQIAREFKVSPTQIRNILKKYGYKPKTRAAGQ